MATMFNSLSCSSFNNAINTKNHFSNVCGRHKYLPLVMGSDCNAQENVSMVTASLHGVLAVSALIAFAINISLQPPP